MIRKRDLVLKVGIWVSLVFLGFIVLLWIGISNIDKLDFVADLMGIESDVVSAGSNTVWDEETGIMHIEVKRSIGGVDPESVEFIFDINGERVIRKVSNPSWENRISLFSLVLEEYGKPESVEVFFVYAGMDDGVPVVKIIDIAGEILDEMPNADEDNSKRSGRGTRGNGEDRGDDVIENTGVVIEYLGEFNILYSFEELGGGALPFFFVVEDIVPDVIYGSTNDDTLFFVNFTSGDAIGESKYIIRQDDNVTCPICPGGAADMIIVVVPGKNILSGDSFKLYKEDLSCGNGVCQWSQSCLYCEEDCGICDGKVCIKDEECMDGHFCVHEICRRTEEYCGDAFCDAGESCEDCWDDCDVCDSDNDVCEITENCLFQPDDCGICPSGDGSCDSSIGESYINAWDDCGYPECGDGVCTGDETSVSCSEDCGHDYETDVYTNFDDWTIWDGWYDGVDVSEKTFLISPMIDVGSENEQAHHWLTVDYSGSGRVKQIIGHYWGDDVGEVMNTTYRTNGDYWVSSEEEKYISTQYKSERYSWVILEIEGDVILNEVNHTYWVGYDTEYGHKAMTYNFAGSYLPYRLLYPNNYNSSKSYPLVVSTTGSTYAGIDNKRQMSMVVWGTYAFRNYYYNEEYEAFSIVPQIPFETGSGLALGDVQYSGPYYPFGDRGRGDAFHGGWPAVNKDGFYSEATVALVEDMIANPNMNIDSKRIYHTGFSYGGKAAYEFAREAPDLWAAIWSVGGWPIGSHMSSYLNYPEDDPLIVRFNEEVSTYKHIPFRASSGEDDSMWSGGELACRVINEQGGNCTHDTFLDIGHVPSCGRAYGNSEYVDWLFGQVWEPDYSLSYLNGGNPIDFKNGARLNYYSWTTSIIDKGGNLVYFFEDIIYGKIMGRYNLDKKSWELFTFNGWSSDGGDVPRPISEGIFNINKIRSFTIPDEDGIFLVLGAYGKTALIGLDVHGSVFNFIVGDTGFSRWAKETYNLFYGRALNYGWSGSSSDNYDYDMNDEMGILINTVGSFGKPNTFRATKYDVGEKKWTTWNDSGWLSPYQEKATQIPYDSSSATDSFSLPLIRNINGTNDFILLYILDNKSAGSKSIRAAKYDGSSNEWLHWNEGWNVGAPRAITEEIYSINNMQMFNVGDSIYLFYRIDETLKLLVYDGNNWQLFNILTDSLMESVRVGLMGEKFYIYYSNDKGINLINGDVSKWTNHGLVFNSDAKIRIEDVNFVEGHPVVFFMKEENGVDRLFTVSGEDSKFWSGGEVREWGHAVVPRVMDSSRVGFNRSFYNGVIQSIFNGTDYCDRGNSYGTQPAGHLGSDAEGNLYIPRVNVCNVGIFPGDYSSADADSHVSHNWGGFWEYFYFPSSVSVDNIRNKVYITSHINRGGGGDFGMGRLQVWDKDLNDKDILYRFFRGTCVDPAAARLDSVKSFYGFNHPSDSAIDEANAYLYVTDSLNNRIRKYDISSGGPVFIEDIGSEGDGNLEFRFPQGIDVDSDGNVYVVDSYNHRVQKFDKDGGYILEWGGIGYAKDKFVYPYAISIDSIRNISVVTDPYNRAVKIFDLDGEYIYHFGVSDLVSDLPIKDYQMTGVDINNGTMYLGIGKRMFKFDVSEGIAPYPEYCIDNDEDMYYTGGGLCGEEDCNDNDKSVHPQAEEFCDLIDQNCDGSVNNDITSSAGCSISGSCYGAFKTCDSSGVWSECSIMPSEELCDGFDNDCNGIVDNGLGCMSNIFIKCGDADINGNSMIFITDSNILKDALAAEENCVVDNNFCNGADLDKSGYVDDRDICLFHGAGISYRSYFKYETACINSDREFLPENIIYLIEIEPRVCIPL